MSPLSFVAALAFAALPQQTGQQPALTVEPTQFRLEVDASRKLELRPAGLADAGTIRWVSRDPAIASVAADGSGGAVQTVEGRGQLKQFGADLKKLAVQHLRGSHRNRHR